MRDYVNSHGESVSSMPTERIQRTLDEGIHNDGINGASTEDLIERLRIELLIRSLGL